MGHPLRMLAIVALVGCKHGESDADTSTEQVRYTPDWPGVTALIADRCMDCHADGGSGGIVLPDAIAADLAAGTGTYVVPLDPDASSLWRVLEGTLADGDIGVMPLGSGPLPIGEVDHVRVWILNGALFEAANIDNDGDGAGLDTDCDDTNAAIGPEADELCDGIDNNCDGATDDASALDAGSWYVDADLDEFGDDADVVSSCEPVDGRITAGGDCDDGDAAIRPGAAEFCDGLDQDCDGTADDAAVDGDTWYTDADKDGYGASSPTTTACSSPAGFSHVSGDCNDADATFFPGAPETCKGPATDNNCDGSFGNLDGDKDGTPACDDCDDSDKTVHPGATETCNGVDDNCDGRVDEAGATGLLTWFSDADTDGHGVSNSTQVACTQPVGFASVGDDCNDADKSVFPGATETCDGVDDDCDNVVDDNVVDGRTYFRDADNDAHGASLVTIAACATPSGYVASSDDCNDANATIYLGAPELCDTLDNDCDGVVDDNATGLGTWYKDADGDTYGTSTSTTSCSQPSGFAARAGDCNDANAAIHPGVTDPADAVDNDCDGLVDEDGKTWSCATNIQPIWNANCTTCHGGKAPAQQLDLSGNGCDNVISVASTEVPSMKLVQPSNSAQSYLWHKVNGTHLTVGGMGTRMPKTGSLSATELATFQAWIDSGAAP